MSQPEKYSFIDYKSEEVEIPEVISRSEKFYQNMDRRRSLRHFSSKPVPRQVIENLIKTASTAPSGAHKQPWHFCAVGDPLLKKQIREAAEKEEFESYNHRMPDEWLEDLAPLGTDWKKPFLEIAPWLIIVFRQNHSFLGSRKKKNYYVTESCGLASGFLLAAIHNAGLVALTHTPSPMNFLSEILQRPESEKPFLLIPVGYPADDARVPDLKRKPIGEIATFY